MKCLQADIALSCRCADGGRALTQPVGASVGQHAQPSSLVDIVDGIHNAECRSVYFEQAHHDIGEECMSMNQVWVKGAQQAMRSAKANQQAHKTPAHSQIGYFQRCRTRFQRGISEHHHRDSVPSRGHALGHCNRLAFRSADAQGS